MPRRRASKISQEAIRAEIKECYEKKPIYRDSLIEFATCETSKLKNVISFLNASLYDMTMEFSSQGIRIYGENANRGCNVCIFIDKRKLDVYNYNYNAPFYRVDMRAEHLNKTAKSLALSTVLTFYIKNLKQSRMIFKTINTENRVFTKDKIATIDGESSVFDIGDRTITHVVMVNSECLQQQLSKISCSATASFRVEGGGGRPCFIISNKSDSDEKITTMKSLSPNGLLSIDNYVDADKSFTFNVKHLTKFLKGLNNIDPSNREVSLNFSDGDVLIIRYILNDFANIDVYIREVDEDAPPL